MRDRLIELKRQAVNYAQEKADERGGLVCIDDEVDYLLANGVIVPPVRYGDEIYYLFPQQGIQRAFVRRIQIGKYGVAICTKYGATLISEIGKTVFLTKEEAEKALAERNGNNG